MVILFLSLAAVTMMSQAGAPSSSAQAISIIKGPSAVTENRVLTTFDTRPTGAQAGGTQSIPVPAIPASGSPRGTEIVLSSFCSDFLFFCQTLGVSLLPPRTILDCCHRVLAHSFHKLCMP